MIALPSFAGKKIGVFGLARSGQATVRALKNAGAEIFAWDDREVSRAGVGENANLLSWEQWPWRDMSSLVLSPGVPLTYPRPHDVVALAREAGVEVIGDIELFARAIGGSGVNAAPIIAITGTNGKSTTTALVGHILQSCGFKPEVGGNIGKSVLELSAPTAKSVYVLEISSYQADLAPGLAPDISVLTNLSPDHIDRHGTMENYAAIKSALVGRTHAGGHAVVSVDDEYSAATFTATIGTGIEAVGVSVGKVLGRGIFVIEGKLYDGWNQPAALIGDLHDAIHLPGAHNWQNAALAYGALKRLVRDPLEIFSAITRFGGLAHRMEDVGRIGKVRFINDSKATNAEAAARALACYGDIFWIAGGKAKEGGIASLAPFFPAIRKAYLIGDAANAFSNTLTDKVDYVMAGTLERAVANAFADAQVSGVAEPVVLLSPACASFDQFRDFEARGDVFRTQVSGLMQNAPPFKAEARR